MTFNLAVILSESAAAAPERTVASFAEGQLTYRELDVLSDRFAAALTEKGLGRGSPALWCTAVLTLHRVHPRVGPTAWLPHGRGRHTALRAMVRHLHARHHGLPPPWVDEPT